MVLFAKVVHSTLALLPFFVFIEKRLGQHWLCTEKGDTLVKYATAGLDPNIFVQKYMIELPIDEEINAFIASSNN